MSNGYSASDVTLAPGSVVGASATNTAITREYPITAGGSIHHAIVIDVTAVTVSTAITAKLQTAVGNTWQDSKTVSISATGRFYIKLNAETSGDQTYLPLLGKGRVVLTTGSGDTATITAVNVLQEL